MAGTVGKNMSRKNKDKKNTIQVLEEAFNLLRKSELTTLFYYYLGSMPFAVALLYFFNDMSKNAFAKDYCLTASLGLTILFIWMKTWQAIFSIQVFKSVSNIDYSPKSFRAVCSIVLVQTIVHVSSIIVLPVASIVMIPFAWCLSLYQLILIQNWQDGISVKKNLTRNYSAAREFTFLNHMVILIFSVFGFIVFINVVIIIYALPFLVKALFGIESVFTRGGFMPFNTTFLFSAAVLTYLFVDPIFKTVFVLEKFYIHSKKSGADIIANLKDMSFRIGKTILIVTCISTIAFGQGKLIAEETGDMSDKNSSAQMISPAYLDTIIEKTLNQREYAWKLPYVQDEKPEADKGFVYKSIDWLLKQLKKGIKTIGNWIKKLVEWIAEKLARESKEIPSNEKKAKANPDILAAILIGIVAIGLLVLIIRKGKNDKNIKDENVVDTSIPDITDEHLTADELESRKWIELAIQLMNSGDLRLAMRALYMGTLAYLAEKEIIIIARYKSNYEYRQEIRRRAHQNVELIKDFNHIVMAIDRAWYGMQDVNQQEYDNFFIIQKRILDFDR